MERYTQGGDGGIGYQWTINGTTYAGGGGGNGTCQGKGGDGGGGNGQQRGYSTASGCKDPILNTPGTLGGGGGGGDTGANGGDGLIVFEYGSNVSITGCN